MRIRILLLIKVMRIYDSWSADPPNYDFNANPDQAFHLGSLQWIKLLQIDISIRFM